LGTSLHQTRDEAVQNQLTRTALVSRVQAADRRVQALESTEQQAQRDLQAAEDAKLTGTSLGAQAQARLDRLRKAAGYAEVSGQGIDLVLKDSAAASGQQDDPGRIVDRDVQFAVNGLWQAGATAIAINDRRLTASSAIRAAGQAILVDYRPLVPPYHIRAIAPDAGSLAGAFRDGPAGLMLEELETQYGVIWELYSEGSITIPAATSHPNGG
jgi:uncharacterized protein YlxW (UPF0749 family)